MINNVNVGARAFKKLSEKTPKGLMMLWRHIGIVRRFAEGNQNNNNSENSSGNNNKYRIRISSEKRPLNHAATAVL